MNWNLFFDALEVHFPFKVVGSMDTIGITPEGVLKYDNRSKRFTSSIADSISLKMSDFSVSFMVTNWNFENDQVSSSRLL